MTTLSARDHNGCEQYREVCEWLCQNEQYYKSVSSISESLSSFSGHWKKLSSWRPQQSLYDVRCAYSGRQRSKTSSAEHSMENSRPLAVWVWYSGLLVYVAKKVQVIASYNDTFDCKLGWVSTSLGTRKSRNRRLIVIEPLALLRRSTAATLFVTALTWFCNQISQYSP